MALWLFFDSVLVCVLYAMVDGSVANTSVQDALLFHKFSKRVEDGEEKKVKQKDGYSAIPVNYFITGVGFDFYGYSMPAA